MVALPSWLAYGSNKLSARDWIGEVNLPYLIAVCCTRNGDVALQRHIGGRLAVMLESFLHSIRSMWYNHVLQTRQAGFTQSAIDFSDLTPVMPLAKPSGLKIKSSQNSFSSLPAMITLLTFKTMRHNCVARSSCWRFPIKGSMTKVWRISPRCQF
jgi:hypothetical protein